MSDAWSVPREWPGARCFVLCGGESIKAQRDLIPKLEGRVIAVKHGVLLRPDADVLFITGEREAKVSAPLVPHFTGTYIVNRGRRCPELPPQTKRVGRSKEHGALCDIRTMVSGYDGGTSAINLAYHFGAIEIVMLGYDMTGGRWFNDDKRYRMPNPSPSNFLRHMAPLYDLADDAKSKGIRIVNCSPISRVQAFERQPLEAFL
jgi:hypothetical protein